MGICHYAIMEHTCSIQKLMVCNTSHLVASRRLVFQDDVQCVYDAGTAEDRLKHVEVGND